MQISNFGRLVWLKVSFEKNFLAVQPRSELQQIFSLFYFQLPKTLVSFHEFF